MEIGELTYSGNDFAVLKQYAGWKLGFLRYSQRFSKFTELERHLQTDEVFVLLEGTATLYTKTEKRSMKGKTLYNIPRGIWHHIVVSPDATVLVIENSNTTKENTERMTIEC